MQLMDEPLHEIFFQPGHTARAQIVFEMTTGAIKG